MKMKTVTLSHLAYARSGDKGTSANIAVIAYTPAGYACLKQSVTAGRVQEYFKPLDVVETVRYELPYLLAFNFVMKGALRSPLRSDAQGKALGQALLEMSISVPIDL